MTLKDARKNIGRYVTYTPYEGCPKEQLELGVITSVNNNYVFVRYGNDINSKATYPEHLKLASYI